MKPVTQTIFGSEKGNCLAAAISSITGIEICDIPDFNDDGERWLLVMEKWLEKRNWTVKLRSIAIPSPKGFCIGVGVSPRDPNVDHCAIYKNGELIFDVHPSQDGVKAVSYWIVLRRSKRKGLR